MSDKDFGSNRQGDLPTEFVSVPVAVLEAVTRRDSSIATAVEVRGWAYQLLAVHSRTRTASAVGTERSEVNQNNQVIP
jgi:hypothetical protein